MTNNFSTTIQECDNTDDLFVELPDQLIESLGWEIGDTIDWQIDDEGIIITKVNKN